MKSDTCRDGNVDRRRSIRLPGFDYSQVGMYFVTICSGQQQCIFGQIRGTEIVLSRVGEVAKACWLEIPQHFRNVKMETYVVMPNHVHGILTIQFKLPVNASAQCVNVNESFGKPSANSIPTIIRSFKSAVSKRAREAGLIPADSIWQRGYYERVLRNTREYVEATNYILLNPARWSHDEENPNKVKDT